ncbi:uncharacterized protein LOC135146069 [Zophobas morio]|uniref:uncharacterized protein LOC135146069 n=1 Tax=Zophobas morio TaxID=2755281 RepID=UPI003082A9C8
MRKTQVDNGSTIRKKDQHSDSESSWLQEGHTFNGKSWVPKKHLVKEDYKEKVEKLKAKSALKLRKKDEEIAEKNETIEKLYSVLQLLENKEKEIKKELESKEKEFAEYRSVCNSKLKAMQAEVDQIGGQLRLNNSTSRTREIPPEFVKNICFQKSEIKNFKKELNNFTSTIVDEFSSFFKYLEFIIKESSKGLELLNIYKKVNEDLKQERDLLTETTFKLEKKQKKQQKENENLRKEMERIQETQKICEQSRGDGDEAHKCWRLLIPSSAAILGALVMLFYIKRK